MDKLLLSALLELGYNKLMDILRGIGRLLLSLAVALMLTAWISAGVLQATLFNRAAVPNWLRESGVYGNAINTAFQVQEPANDGDTQAFATKDDLKNALLATFTPSYIQQQSENALGSIYDWIEGKAQTISFTIPIEQKQAEFKTNFTKQIEAKLTSLPPCPTRVNPSPTNPTCIPQGMSAADLATRLTPQITTEGGAFLDKPITASGLNLNTNATWVPAAYASTKLLTFVLPFAIILAAAMYVFISDPKLKGLSTISRRIALNGLLLVIGGIVIAQVGRTYDFNSLLNDSTMGAIINPLLHQVAPAIGQTLAVMGGAVMAVGGISWGIAFYLRRRQQSVGPRSGKPQKLPAPPAPTQAQQEEQPPAQTKPPVAPPRPPSVV
ncbi:MAG TPA: hypothetical protein VLA88_06565 [Candidatus Saccharimonadales bacterium]|nr:hypothetical protein [Candidatus Saccharimonadales bacterium]